MKSTSSPISSELYFGLITNQLSVTDVSKSERLIESDGKSKWVTADLFYKPRWRCEGEPEFKVYHAYRGRYYDLFATLADVRNGSGNEFIDSPRGLPSDCCETVKSEHDWCSEDWHSASWFTLKELKDWQKI